ncbi:hypothetical protein [Mumia sp. Pv 4-285]|uniref:hypothetical protein n=1 Tax=Mumia qirimensis TaxID=3234852 RepID=UPI00351D9A7B
MLVAIGSADYTAACEMTAVDGVPVESDAGEECAERLRVFAEGMSPSALGQLRGVEVASVRASGETVEIPGTRVAGAPQSYQQSVFELVRLDGLWYVVGT